MTDMTLAEALALADHASPMPHLAGQALKVLRAEIERHAEWVTDYKILWGVVANAGRLATERKVRWAHVSDATGLGSQSSIDLCRRCGFDPDDECGEWPVAADPDPTAATPEGNGETDRG